MREARQGRREDKQRCGFNQDLASAWSHERLCSMSGTTGLSHLESREQSVVSPEPVSFTCEPVPGRGYNFPDISGQAVSSGWSELVTPGEAST